MGKVTTLPNRSTFNRRTAARLKTARRVRLMAEQAATHDVAAPELLTLYRQAVRNATARGIAFELSETQFLDICARSGGRCEVSGIPFDVTFSIDQAKRPWAPSLDRIDSTKGYISGNCRLVTVAANLSMNAWGEQVLLKLALAVADRARRGDNLPTDSENLPTVSKHYP
jgi:hypothetical protein